MVENLAHGLDVSLHAIEIPNIENYIVTTYTLLQLEHSYRLKIDEINTQPVLWFDKLLPHERNGLYEYMNEWLKVAKDFREGKTTEVQYEEWKYNFPKYSTLNGNGITTTISLIIYFVLNLH